MKTHTTMTMTLVTTMTAAALALGCGGSSKKAAAGPGDHDEMAEHEGHEGMDDGDEHHGDGSGGGGHKGEHNMPAGPLATFHDTLAPLWHAPEGADRVTKTCDAAATMHDQAGALATAPAPDKVKDAAAWNSGVTALTAAIDDLAADCATPSRASFAAKFGHVHEAFHVLLELTE